MIKANTLENVARNTTVLLKSKSEEVTEHIEIIEKERDILKKAYINGQEVHLIICGVEQQSHVDESMPFRVLLYDCFEYLRQVTDIRQRHKRKKDVSGAEYLSLYAKEDKLTPTISIVFYTGKEMWHGNCSMMDMYEPNPMLRALASNVIQYKMNFISVYHITEIHIYRSDLRLLFAILKHTEDCGDLTEFLVTHREYERVNELT